MCLKPFSLKDTFYSSRNCLGTSVKAADAQEFRNLWIRSGMYHKKRTAGSLAMSLPSTGKPLFVCTPFTGKCLSLFLFPLLLFLPVATAQNVLYWTGHPSPECWECRVGRFQRLLSLKNCSLLKETTPNRDALYLSRTFRGSPQPLTRGTRSWPLVSKWDQLSSRI